MVVLSKSDPPVLQFNPTLQPEELFTTDNIGRALQILGLSDDEARREAP